MFVSVRRRGEGSTRARASARRCAVRFRGWIRATAFASASPRDWRTRRVLFGKAKRRASGKNIFTMARGRSGPAARDAGTRRAPRGVSRVRNSSRGSLLVGRKGGHAHAAAAANDRPPFQHAALGVNGANLRALEAEHTARHPASGRFNDLGAEVAHGAAEAARLSAFRSAIDTRSRPRTAQAVRRSLCWVWCSAWGRRRTFLWFLPFPEAGNRKARVRICSKGAENREDSSYGHAYSLSSRTHRKYGPTAHFVRVVCPARRAVAHGQNSPIHLPPRTSRGANPRRPASGYRPNPRVRSKAGSATAGGSKRIAPESSFSRLAPGRIAGLVSTSAGFPPCAGDERGKPMPGTMPTDRVDAPQVVPWLEKDDLAYYGPFRCVSAPARPARRPHTTSTRSPLPRFSRAKTRVATESIPRPREPRPSRARVGHPATRERVPLRRTPPRTPLPRTPRPKRCRRASSARLASLADANPLLSPRRLARAGTTCVCS